MNGTDNRTNRLRRYRHLLLSKVGSMTDSERFWLKYLDSILGT